MYPIGAFGTGAFLVDELVEREVVADVVEEPFVALSRVNVDVGSFATEVLRVFCP